MQQVEKQPRQTINRYLWGIATLTALAGLQLQCPSLAQVSSDGTLPNPSRVDAEGSQFEISGGTEVGENLFHSLTQLDLDAGEVAHFQNTPQVRHIITRITGGSASQIDGTLRANGVANLYLLNANGLVFGENARLDIGGSFVASTGNLQFADGSTFTALPEPSTPLLSMSVPVGLQVPPNRGQISVSGTGHNLFFNSDFSTNRDDRPDGFAVSPGQRLDLVAGDIEMTGANVTATDGEIALVALASGTWNFQGNFETPDNRYGEIRLSEATAVDVSGNGGGELWVYGENLFLAGGSTLLADTLGAVPGRGITVRVRDTVDVRGFSPDGLFSSGFFATVGVGASGHGGDVLVESDRLLVVDGAIVGADTFGSGNAGTLEVRSREIETRNSFWSGSSFSTATGRGGRIVLVGDRLLAADGAQILALSNGPGDAGAIEVQMSDWVEIRGAGESANTLFNSVLAASVEASGSGRGGRVTVETGQLRVLNGGAISAGTSGNSPASRAGTLQIRASESIEVLGTNIDGVPSNISSNTFASAPGANVLVETPFLRVEDGGQIASGTFGTGNGGRVVLNVGEEIRLTGRVPVVEVRNRDFFKDESGAWFPSGIFSASEGEGAAGNLQVRSPEMRVRDGAEVAVSSRGTGSAGSLSVFANRVRLHNGGRFRADSAAGLGSISVAARTLQMTHNSQISTNARGLEPGGNLFLQLQTLVARGNSDITATSANSRGGRIQIEALGIFGAERRNRITPASDITASSALGTEFSGVVAVREPDLTTNPGLLQVDAEVVEVAGFIADNCSALRSGSRFVVTGRGGLSLEDPRFVGVGGFAVVEPRSLPETEARESASSDTPPHWVEATQWQRQTNGKVVLSASREGNAMGDFQGESACES